MAVSDDIVRYRPKLGEEGERCTTCGVPLAEDQRYCLNCGSRRGNARIPFMDVLRDEWESDRAREAQQVEEERTEAAAGPPERNWSPLIAAAAGGAVAIVLGLGFVIAQSGDNSAPPASRPQVIQVGGASGTPTANAATFTGDWPADKQGWTVQLQTLPKASTQPAAVTAAKTSAEGKGAKDVGALDADQFAGLDAGNYVVYSGVFDDEKTAKKRLNEVKSAFPDATVIQVGGSANASSGGNGSPSGKKQGTVGKDTLNQLQGLSPQEYQKKAKKLPDTTVLPGHAPPKDNKSPGAGSGAETIK